MDVSLAQKAKGTAVPGATGKPTPGGVSSWLPRGATTPTRQNVPGASPSGTSPPGNAAKPGTMTSDQAAAEIKAKGAASAASQWLPRGVSFGGDKKPPAK